MSSSPDSAQSFVPLPKRAKLPAATSPVASTVTPRSDMDYWDAALRDDRALRAEILALTEEVGFLQTKIKAIREARRLEREKVDLLMPVVIVFLACNVLSVLVAAVLIAGERSGGAAGNNTCR